MATPTTHTIQQYNQLTQIQMGAEAFWDGWNPKDRPDVSGWTIDQLGV